MKRLFGSIVLALVVVFAFGIAAEATDELPYIIEEGTVYYESSWNFGSGRQNVVRDENPYTTDPCYAGINGYSFLDMHGNILACDYNESTNDIIIPEAPEGTVKSFKHFRSTYYRNGWVGSDTVKSVKAEKTEVVNESAEQTPEEVVTNIANEILTTEKTAIIIDYSGSMAPKQQQVVDLIGTLQFNENTTIIVFGTDFAVVSVNDLKTENFNVGSGTHMIQALNKALEFEVEKIILISDLDTYGDVDLIPSNNLKSVKIYNPSYYELYYNGGEYWADHFISYQLQPIWGNVQIDLVKIK